MSQITKYRIGSKSFQRGLERDLSALSLIFLITFSAFLNLFRVGFMNDDFDFLFTWNAVHDFNHIPLLLTGNTPILQEGVFRPIRSLFYVLSYNLWHLNLTAYHIQELFIYFLSLLFVYLITKELVKNRLISFITTLFFGILPLHIDNVANLTGNFDTVGAVFFFIAFYLFQLSLRMKQKKLLLLLSTLFAGFAYFIYEITLVFPLLLLLYVFYTRKKLHRFVASAHVFLAVSYLSIRFLAHIPSRGVILDNTILWKLILTVIGVFSYLLRTLIHNQIQPITVLIYSLAGPLHLNNTPKIELSLNDLTFRYQFIFATIAIILTLIVAFRNLSKHYFSGFCLLWFYIGILPAIFIGIHSSSHFFGALPMFDRYAFIASYGICLLIGNYCYKILIMQPKSLLGISLKTYALIMVCALFFLDFFVTSYNLSNLKDPNIVMRTWLLLTKPSEFKYNDLGVVSAYSRHFSEAVSNFKYALTINRNYAIAQSNLQILCQYFHRYPQISESQLLLRQCKEKL